MSDLRDAFIKSLDAQQPEWWISFAGIADLQEVIRSLNYEAMDWKEVTAEDFAVSFERNRSMLKRRIAERLMMPVRACVHAGLVTPKEGF